MCRVSESRLVCPLRGHDLKELLSPTFREEWCFNAEENGSLGKCGAFDLPDRDEASQGPETAVAAGTATPDTIERIVEPSYLSPYCRQCAAVDSQLMERVDAAVRLNLEVGSAVMRILSEEWFETVRGKSSLPNFVAPAPDLSHMTRCLGESAGRQVSPMKINQAVGWLNVDCVSQTTDDQVKMFVKWYTATYQKASLAAALTIARAEGSKNRETLLQVLALETQQADVYRARLEVLGVFRKYLEAADIQPITDDSGASATSQEDDEMDDDESDGDSLSGTSSDSEVSSWDENCVLSFFEHDESEP